MKMKYKRYITYIIVYLGGDWISYAHAIMMQDKDYVSSLVSTHQVIKHLVFTTKDWKETSWTGKFEVYI